MKREFLRSLILVFFLGLLAVDVANGQTTYYSGATGSPTNLGNWWTNTNATGGNPANFTTAGDVFTIQNTHTLTTAAAWTVTGTVIIQSGGVLTLNGAGSAGIGTLTINSGGTINRSSTGTITTALANFTNAGTVNISGSGIITGITNNAGGIVNHSGSSTITTFNNATSTSTLNISTTPTVPTITLTVTAAGNTVNYTGAGAQTVISSNYSNLGLSGSGNKTFGAALTISGNLSITGAVADLGTGFTHTANTLTLGGAAQVNGSYGSTASAATNKNNTYFLTGTTGIVNATFCAVPTGTAITYYSRNATAGIGSVNWDDNTSWTTSADGTGGPLAAGVWPLNYDNVVIRSGHIIIVNSVSDNKYCGISPDALARANVGPVASIPMFYQTGDITVNGRLITSGVEIMVEGNTHFTSTAIVNLGSTLVNLGYLEVAASATMTGLDDIILSGNSTTIINTNSTQQDDLIIDYTNATLCGTGTTALTTNGGSTINYLHSASLAQICTSFQVTCPNGGCTGAPATGTGIVLLGNSGPGGVASTDGASALKVWLDAQQNVFSDAGVTASTNGGVVQQWNDRSGSTNNAIKTISNRPTFVATDATINNAPAVLFTSASSQYFDLTTFTLDPSASSFSIISVLKAVSSGSNMNIIQQQNGTGIGRSILYLDVATAPPQKIGSFLGNVSTLPTADYTYGTWSILSNTYNLVGPTTSINLYKAGTADGAASVTPEAANGNWRIGANKTAALAFMNGSVSELLILNQSINNAKRIIIENYLSAKYAITLATNDVYTMDDVGNGNFDYEVAGIGQASDASNHKDAKGTGIVRMWNPNGLGNGEFLLWGHNNATLVSSTTTVGLAGVDGTVIEERLVRIWRVTELSGDVGTVSISFDLSLLPSTLLGSNLRLLIDRNGDGFGDNDVTPVAGSFSNNTIVFSGINFQSGDRFTLGNTDLSASLPIELLNFKATLKSEKVVLDWSTATELNNDYFTVERATDVEKFEEVGMVKGKGNSSSITNYNLIDTNPLPGVSYYRLKQTDFDGTFTYSAIRKVENSNIQTQFKVYPTIVDHAFTFELTGIDPEMEVPLRIINLHGVTVFNSSYKADLSGRIKNTVELPRVSSGMYLVIVDAKVGLRQKIVVP